MAVWSDFLLAVRNTSQDNVSDSGGNFVVADEQILRYFRYAQLFAASRHPSLKRATLSVDSVARTCTIPGSAYRIAGVYTSGEALEESTGLRLRPNQYAVVSDTEIKIGNTSVSTVDVIYQGEYDTIAGNGNDLIPGPEWLEEALFNFVVARVLAHLSVSSGDVAQWRTRSDSGNPEHNPLLELSRYYDELAEKALARRQQR